MKGKAAIDFNEKKGFICDMDGVIYHGNRILPGVAEFIQWLREENKEYLFLTNNSGYTPRELKQKLARMGLDVSEEHFYTSALATAAFLREQAPGCSVFVIGEAGLLNALIEMATGTQAYFCGKPNPLMMRTGLNLLSCHSAEAVMVGDRMDTDVISGMESGMSTVLVLSGVSTRETLRTYAYQPSIVLEGVGEIAAMAKKAKGEA